MIEGAARATRWPSATAYREALADPSAVGDPALRAYRLETDDRGRAKEYLGTSAVVFRLRGAGSDLALRCFRAEIDNLDRRYTAISELLTDVRNDALCRTAYRRKGVRVAGAWWPTVYMDWAGGSALDVAVARRVGDSEATLALARAFRELVRGLEPLDVAHGDLQHGNIRVDDAGRLRLIDYDLMFVPELAGLEQAGFGQKNYQHPQRRVARFDARLDRFSAIVIYTSLVALAALPSLWDRFHEGDNLIFRAHDFTAMDASPLVQQLRSHAATAQLAELLTRACAGPVDDVPTLEDAIAATSGTMLAPARRRSRAAERPRRRTIPLLPSAAGVVVAGLAIGIALSARHHVPRAPTPQPHHAPAAVAVVTPRAAATRVPTRAPRPIVRAGTWRIDEANRLVGTMVWSADAVRVAGNRLIINAHKTAVGSRAATPCERATTLHTAIPLAGAPETVPYRETNCAGQTSTGEVRVRRLGNNTIAGSFWRGGTKLGDFTGSKE
jgi:hypothetical protein